MPNPSTDKDWLDENFGVFVADKVRNVLIETARRGHGEVTICFRAGHPYKIETDHVELLDN